MTVRRCLVFCALAAIGACSKKQAPEAAKPVTSAAAAVPSASASASPETVSTAPGEIVACPDGMKSIQGGAFEPDGVGALTRVESFCIDATEVTVGAYRACKSCSAPDTFGSACNWGEPGRDDHPVNCVTWTQADAYCKAVQKRLPTEYEWEFAASGTVERTYPWGEEAPASQLCWHRSHIQGKPGHNREGTCPVGSFPSGGSPFGAEDMAGNVREWTSSEYDEHKKPDDTPRPGTRVVRGSDWTEDKVVRNGFRSWNKPSEHFDDLGFRCAK